MLFSGNGLKIEATQGGGFSPQWDIPRYVALWRSEALDDYQKLISHRVSLDSINNGIDLVKTGQAARVMVDIS
jgi:Zn-dependent alcohol dehydrogenase